MSVPFKIRVSSPRVQKRYFGRVLAYRDGIAQVSGLGNIGYYELVEFEGGATGFVLDVDQETSSVALIKGSVRVGEVCIAANTVVAVPVGENLLGRVVSALGEPLDGKPLALSEVYPVERPAHPIYERSKVNEPVETGINAIDMLVPIGHGQRELILGDRQTGKTTLAADILLNQRGKDVIGIYVSVGQKAADTASIISSFETADVLDQIVVVVASASDPAILRYLAPYAATSMAEYFMEKGKKAIIVYDDLSKHAVSYRELSLLLRRPPGREAYPGDIFYAHSRLLERAAKLVSGGSLTALPICETQLGDFSAYIPTNLISITDGQLYLDSLLFNLGRRPAVNVGLSVSRVGGAAQYGSIRKLASGLKATLARYDELSEFTKFGGKLDEASQKLLERGERTINLLVQKAHELYEPFEQAAMLVLLNNGFFDQIDPEEVRNVWTGVREYLRANLPQLREMDFKKPFGSEEVRLIASVAERVLKSGKPVNS